MRIVRYDKVLKAYEEGYDTTRIPQLGPKHDLVGRVGYY